MYLVTFTVKGTGRFPLDMLRYAQCWPATSDDVVALDSKTPIAITLRLHSRTKTPDAVLWGGRWASFGWNIIPSMTRVTKL
jgi:hypothetical protein